MNTEQTPDPISCGGQWLLEGGDDPWEELAERVGHCLDEVIGGGVLEVISWFPGVELKVGGWCVDAGHELIHVLKEGASTRFWIKKCETPSTAYLSVQRTWS